MTTKKRWLVRLMFMSPSVRAPVCIDAREFRFLWSARLFAWRSEAWSGWKSINAEIVDQRL